MSRINRKVLAMAVSSMLVAGAMVAPSMASAKTIKGQVKVKSVNTAGKLSGDVLSGVFGKGKQSGTVLPPQIRAVWKVKGGTVKAKTDDGHIVGADIVATAKLTGTGKYKKLKAKCTVKGPLAALTLTYTCKGTY